MSTISSFKSIGNKHEVYRGKGCIKRLLTKQQQKSYQNAKICYICKEKFEDIHSKDIHSKDKNYGNVRDQLITQENIEMLHIAHVI